MGEFHRKYVALSEGEFAALSTAMRQLGVGSQGGASSVGSICDGRASGSLNTPLTRIKVDDKKCCGMIEWNAVRKSAALFLPKHTATAGWFHLEHTKDFRQCPRIVVQSREMSTALWSAA